MTNTICTIVSGNYLAHAKTLGESLRYHHPKVPFHVLLVDKIDDESLLRNFPFPITTIRELNIPNVHDMCFKYSILELNTAVKPFWLKYLFQKTGTKTLFYFDPDIYVYQPINFIFSLLESHNVVLTPHLLTWPKNPISTSEVKFLQCGCYNLGFIALTQNALVHEFLDWWSDKLKSYCYSLPREGLFVDQKWVDLAVGYFDGFHILRHHGCNAAYWNLRERAFTDDSHGIQVNNDPLIFYHFSGYDIHLENQISKYDTTLTFDDYPIVKKLFQNYRKQLIENGILNYQTIPYAFNFFDNGKQITPEIRYYYKAITASRGKTFENPFQSQSSGSFYQRYKNPIRRIAGLVTILTAMVFRIASKIKTRLAIFRS